MPKLTYKENERVQKARLYASLLSQYESIASGKWRSLDTVQEANYLAEKGLFDWGTQKLSDKGQMIVYSILGIPEQTPPGQDDGSSDSK